MSLLFGFIYNPDKNKNMQKTDIILPWCLFQYIDSTTNTYYSYLGYSVVERNTSDPTGKEYFVCKEPERLYRGWHVAGYFYAINPMPSHPIQTGMKLYCVKQTTGFPYNSTSIHIEYDPFSIDPDSVYFIAYNQRVPFTIPLYVYELGDSNVFISFDPEPPTDDPNWVQASISPIYVIPPSTFREYATNPALIPFKCVNEKCIPWAHDVPDVYDDIPDNSTTTFDRCILLCSGLGLIDEGAPKNIIQQINTKYTEQNRDMNLAGLNKDSNQGNGSTIGSVLFWAVATVLIGAVIFPIKNRVIKTRVIKTRK